MHYLSVFGQHSELHDLLGRFVKDLIPNDDARSKLEGISQNIAEFRNAGSRFVRERSEGSFGPGGKPVKYKINQKSANERSQDKGQGPGKTRPGHLPGRYRLEQARTSENEREREQVERCLACDAGFGRARLPNVLSFSRRIDCGGPPDLARPIDGPSRGPECCSTFGFAPRIRGEGRAVISSRTKYPRLGPVFSVVTRSDRVHVRLRKHHAVIREPRPTKVGLAD